MTVKVTGKYIPGNSIIHRLDPRAGFFGFLFLTAAVIMTDSIPGYLLMTALVAAIVYISGLSINTVLSTLRRLLLFFIVIFVMNALFYTSENPIWHFLIFSLSMEGLAQGGNVVSRVILIIVLSNVFTMTTMPIGIMHAIETMIKPLKFAGLPVEEIAVILAIAVQFIPTILEESDMIRKAQTARGARFESKKLHERALALIPMLLPIFLAAFRRADELSLAMEARGYRGAKHRTALKQQNMNRNSYAALLICASVLTAEIFL